MNAAQSIKFILGSIICVLSIGLPIWVAWRSRSEGRVLGVAVPRWAGAYAIIAAVCASILILYELPRVLADHDALALVGVFFFGVVVCGLFPFWLLIGRCLLSFRRVLRDRQSKAGRQRETVWILRGLALLVVTSMLMGRHWYNARLMTDVSDPDALPETLRAVYAKSRHKWVDHHIEEILAEHPRLPKDVAELFASNGNLWIRNRIAVNPSTDASILRKLSSDSEYWIRVYVAKHHNCPDDVLGRLCVDPQAEVRQAALDQAKKRKTPPPSLTSEVR